MLIYIISYLFAILFAYCASHTNLKALKIIFTLIAVVPLVLVSGLRDDTIGNDTCDYPVKIFEFSWMNSYSDTINEYASDYDYLFVALSWVVTKIFRNFNVLLGSYTLISVVILNYVFLKEYPKHLHLAIATYCIIIYPVSLTLIRQCLAMSFILLAYYHIKRRRYISFAIALCIACLLHRTSIIGLLLIPIVIVFNLKTNEIITKKSKYVLIIITLSLIILILVSLLVFGKQIILLIGETKESYQFQIDRINQSKLAMSSIVLFLFNIFLFFITFTHIKRNILSISKDNIALCAILLTIVSISVILGLFSMHAESLQRVGMSLYMFIPLYYCQIKISNQNNKEKTVIDLMIVLFLVCYMIYTFTGKGSEQIVPYTSEILNMFFTINF